MITKEAKDAALRLRIEGRCGFDEIMRQTHISRASLAEILKDHPLTQEKKSDIRSNTAKRVNSMRQTWKRARVASKFSEMVDENSFNRRQKGRIAEAAVLFRLTLLGFDVWRAVFEGDEVDWLVTKNGSHAARLQVKYASILGSGRPAIKVTNGKGRLYTKDTIDFFVGYDLHTDTAFVIPVEDCIERLRTKTCDAKYAEAWGLLG